MTSKSPGFGGRAKAGGKATKEQYTSTAKSTGKKEGKFSKDVSDSMLKPSKLPTKVVVRRLPPTLTEKDFLDAVSPLDEYNYFHYSPPDFSLSPNGLSWATMDFANEEEVYRFKERFDGYVFVDKRGEEFPAIVEFAPCQKIPKVPKARKDSKLGTIEKDVEYLKFLETLENPTKPTRTMQQWLEEIEVREKEQKNKVATTPLLEYIREQRLEKRQRRDQRRENRRKRDEEKKKQREDERAKRKERKEAEILDHEKRREESDNYRREKTRGGSAAKGSRQKNGENGFGKSEKQSRDRKERSIKTKQVEIKQYKEDLPRDKSECANEGHSDLPPKASKRYSDRKKAETDAEKALHSDASDRKNAVNCVKILTDVPGQSNLSKAEGGDKKERDHQRTHEKKEKVKNKERPAMQIYRPGMGKFSSQTIKAKEGSSSEVDETKPAARIERKGESGGGDLPFRERKTTRSKGGGTKSGNSGRGSKEKASKPVADAPEGGEVLNTKSGGNESAKRKGLPKWWSDEPNAKSAANTGGLVAKLSPGEGRAEKQEKSGKSYRDKRRERREWKAAASQGVDKQEEPR